jgi:hypothetical protein
MDAAARGTASFMNDTRLKMREEEGLDKPRPAEPIYAGSASGKTSPFIVTSASLSNPNVNISKPLPNPKLCVLS